MLISSLIAPSCGEAMVLTLDGNSVLCAHLEWIWSFVCYVAFVSINSCHQFEIYFPRNTCILSHLRLRF